MTTVISEIAARGTTMVAQPGHIVLRPSALTAALSGSSHEVRIDVSTIAGIDIIDGDAWQGAVCEIALTDGVQRIAFNPGDEEGPHNVQTLIDTAKDGGGNSGVASPIPGFDFVGFDVETANPSWGSICQIGLVKIIDGLETDRVSWLCTPPAGIDSFDPKNVAIHGISEDDVRDAPSVSERIDEFVDFTGDLPVVAHNAQFDATALRDACVATDHPIPHLFFGCTLALSRAVKLPVKNHRLPTLAQYFGANLEHHHDACEDAAACAGIMVGLARDAGHSGDLMSFVHDSGFALGVIDDDRVTPIRRDRSGKISAQQVALAKEGRTGGAISPRGSNQWDTAAEPKQEASSANAPWQSVATPDVVPDPNPTADPNSPLYGHNVTLTGEFEPFDKGTLWDGIAEQGGQVGKNVTKKTTILVTGEWATMTSKEKRARELMDKGQDIEIWPASRLFDIIGLDAG